MKIGDKVKVVANPKDSPYVYHNMGKTGKIKTIFSDGPFKFEIEYDDKSTVGAFNEEELKIIKEKVDKFHIGQIIKFQHGPNPKNIFKFKITKLDKDGLPTESKWIWPKKKVKK